ncbi:MAG: RNA polymerase sigma factor [Candidatus Cloacimonadaceae bacterium]|jgi:RNA polymerase sigma factor (sigma-70 family)
MRAEDFEGFLLENQARIYHYLLSLTGNEADSQDLLQMSFIAFYENIDRIEEPTALSYLYRIAYNKSMTFLKQKSRFVHTEPEVFERMADKPPPEPEPDYTPLINAIKELPPRMAAVIQLQYYESLSYKEISERLGITVKAVESLLVRARKILRKKLVKEIEGMRV